jgi:pyruvate dehydrogenase E2 component (dihydrolipoamide acetyltransferase)
MDILMPALAPSMEHATLARWAKREGDTIKRGDLLAEIETDKAMMEFESAHDGVLSKILVPEGTPEVAVNTRIAVVTDESESASPKTIRVEAPSISRIFASPRAKRLASEVRVDLAKVRGSGPRGRIIERDVLNASPRAATAKSIETAATEPRPVQIVRADTFTVIRHDQMRRTIARRLVEAKRSIPHFYLTVDCEMDSLLNVRSEINRTARMNPNGESRYQLSVTDLIIKAWALSLSRIPEANVTWTDEALHQHTYVDVSVAVSLGNSGLITPIIKAADSKSLSALSNELKDLAARAKTRKLRPEEYEGGSTSISNLGMFGVKEFTAVINPPQATILAVGTSEKRVIVKNDQPTVATIMSCTLSVDHRAVDGTLAARVLAEFKRQIESPLGMFV